MFVCKQFTCLHVYHSMFAFHFSLSCLVNLLVFQIMIISKGNFDSLNFNQLYDINITISKMRIIDSTVNIAIDMVLSSDSIFNVIYGNESFNAK